MASALDDPRIARGMAAQGDIMRREVAAGAGILGWKVGFGAPAGLARLRIEAPLVGYLLERDALPSDAVVPVGGWTRPVAEPELCVEMAVDLPGGASEEAARAAIGGIAPSIELVDIDGPTDDVETVLAANIFQRRLVIGAREPSSRRGDVSGLVGTARINGAMQASASDLEANTGKVVAIIRHVADLLAQLGPGLRRGQVIICGSVVPPIALDPAVRTVYFELPPIGSVSVTITR